MRLVLRLLVAGFLSAAVLPAAAQVCDRAGCGRIACGFPALVAPPSLWGELKPAETLIPTCSRGGPAYCRDSTAFNEFTEFYWNYPWYMSVDVENNYLFAGLSHGFQVWDLHANGANPTPVGKVTSTSAFAVWVDSAEQKWPIQDIDAPTGVDDLVTVVGEGGIGLSVFDLADKPHPRLLYQNHRKDGEQVYATKIGSAEYAFMAAKGSSGGGLFTFNLTKAREYSRCAEAVPASGETVRCPSVYMGRVGTRTTALYVDGVDQYVVLSSGAGGGFEIWNIANPASPQLKLDALTSQRPPYTPVYGVALWKEGAKYYLALRTHVEARIYDVTCITGSSCTGPGTLLWSKALDSGAVNFYVTFSRAGSVPFLYFGSDNRCSGSAQREWLYDVRNPAAPHDVTPQTGYWGWYYRGGLTGFNNVMPRTGKFNGSYFYRAGLAIMDFHVLTAGLPPDTQFDWSSANPQIYAGDAVQFHDLTAPAPESRQWTIPDASAAAGAAAPPPPQ